MAAKDDKQETSKTTLNSKNSQGLVRSVDMYAAQCEKCMKWRLIATEEEYEEIRSKIIEDPFVCDRKTGVSCKDAGDIDCDSTRTWVIDKPGIPKTPEGFKRSLVLRKDFSKMDAYYITPTGKKLRTRNEIAAFLEAHPKYSGASVDDFNFTSPKVMEETIPEDVKRANAASASNKRMKASKDAA